MPTKTQVGASRWPLVIAFVPAAGLLALSVWSSWVVDAAWSPSWAYSATGPALFWWSLISAVVVASVVRPLWRLRPALRVVGILAGVGGVLVAAYAAYFWWVISGMAALA